MTTDRELLQQALDLLDDINQCSLPPTGIPLPAEIDHVMEALRARLAQPEPEPVAWMYEYGTDNGDAVNKVRWYKNVSLTPPVLTYNRDVVPLYPAPPQREWQSLTDEEHTQIAIDSGCMSADWVFYGAAIERALKEKNAPNL